MEKLLNIGIIQAIVDSNLAWSDTPQMDVYEANAIWRQIQAAFASFQEMSDTKKPDIVVIPELAVATYFESRIKNYAQKIGALWLQDWISNNTIITELATELYSMYLEIGHMGSKLEKSKRHPSISGSILLHERK